MTIIGGLDLHRAQITYSYIDTMTGEVREGYIRPATRTSLRAWLAKQFAGRADVKLAVEACTGWRFVVEELLRAGIEPHLAEPAETAHLRSPKQRAKTDLRDARHLRDLLLQERLPESWIPPRQVSETRADGRQYLALMAERRKWLQRIHAELFQQGVPPLKTLLTCESRAALAAAELSPDGRQRVERALRMITNLETEIMPLRQKLSALARQLPGPHALQHHYGVGWVCAIILWAELGDCRRFRHADQVVRLAGLDVTVWASDSKRAPGHLARQGAPELRWALFEAAKSGARLSSPDYAYYQEVKARLGAKRATLSVARKLARRLYHTLLELGPQALSSPDAVTPATLAA